MKSRFRYFIESLIWLASTIGIGVVVFQLSRAIFMLTYANWPELDGYSADLFRAFFVGLKFDLKVLTIALAPLLLLAILRLFTGERFGKVFRKVYVGYGTLVLLLVVIFEVINFFFYKFYQTKINVIIFGFLEDDTRAVLVSLWKEYPVIPVLLGLGGVIVSFVWLLRRVVSVSNPKVRLPRTTVGQLVLLLLITGVYFVGMRGTLTVVPLDGRHATISESMFVNTLPVNGLFSFKSAYRDKKEVTVHTDINRMLRSYGFGSIEEAYCCYTGKKLDGKFSLEKLFTATPAKEFLEQNPPNVVFVLMESMSNFYLNIHSKECNLLGSLEQQLPACYLFRHFLPAYSGTIYSLESILVNTPVSPLSQSPYQNMHFSASAIKPFVEKGYETVFVSGEKMGWRNMDKFIPNLYFNRVEADATLLRLYPDAPTGEWGVHDETLFRRLFDILESPSDKPHFIFAMTISHHSPYDIPESYTGDTIRLPDWLMPQLKYCKDVVVKSLKAFQYANSCLGNFIEKIRNSPLGENTIIVATGDHNIRQNINYRQEDLFMQYSVPFIAYIPEKYKPKAAVDTARFGSHKDIFPSLYNLALSDAGYPDFGNNLFSTAKRADFGQYCYNFAADSIGMVSFSSGNVYYKWADKNRFKAVPADSESVSHLDSLARRARALSACMNYYLIRDILKNSKKR